MFSELFQINEFNGWFNVSLSTIINYEFVNMRVHFKTEGS